MEEVAPFVTKVCVLQQKAPLEVSREKRHLLELLEKRHKRYLEKKSCEALELDASQSRDQLSDRGLDNGEYSSRSLVIHMYTASVLSPYICCNTTYIYQGKINISYLSNSDHH